MNFREIPRFGAGYFLDAQKVTKKPSARRAEPLPRRDLRRSGDVYFSLRNDRNASSRARARGRCHPVSSPRLALRPGFWLLLPSLESKNLMELPIGPIHRLSSDAIFYMAVTAR